MMDVPDILARVTALWLAGELAAWLIRHRNPRLGYEARVAVIAGMLALPLLNLALPQRFVEVPWWRTVAAATPAVIDVAVEPLQTAGGPQTAGVHLNWLAAAYAAVAAFLLLRMGAGAIRLRRILKQSRLEEIPEAAELARSLGLDPARIEIRSSPRVAIPFTLGVRRHLVLIPEDWREWPLGKLRSVLAHEMAHTGARDWLAARLAALNRTLYWFHPAAWWLEKRLAAEAEECADQEALAVLGDRKAYVEAILDFARAVQARRLHGLEATAMARNSRTAQRMEKLLSATRFSAQPARKPALAALMLAALPVVVAAALVTPVPQPPEAPPAPPPIVLPQFQAPVSDQEAAEMEAALQKDPNDDRVRFRLLNHYVARREMTRAREHAMALIEQRPETPQAVQATMLWAGVAQRGDAAEDIQQLVQIWKKHVAERPQSARVLSNAAHIMARAGMLFDAESLLQRAMRLDPANRFHTVGLANLYANAILGNAPASPDFRAKVRAELASTPDPLLLAYVAEVLLAYRGPVVKMPGQAAPSEGDSGQFVKEAETYVRRALALDPDNDAAKKVMAIYESRMKGASSPSSAAPRRIRVAANVQQVMLVSKPEPVYPEAARTAGIQGTVRFGAVIGDDGTVKNLTLFSGHPLLAQAAMEAVQKYRYRPTLLNGEPVEVETEIHVPFTLPGAGAPQSETRSLPQLVGAGDQIPVPIHKVEPGLTPEARAARVRGTVVLEILIDEEGLVREAKVLRGLGLGLDEKAIEAVSQWKFKPALRDRKPIAVRANVEMNFRVE